jgi:hypothetical protein
MQAMILPAADRGDSVIAKGENGGYVFERRAVGSDHPFAGLEDVFGAVTVPPVVNEVEQWAPRMDFADACAQAHAPKPGGFA